MDKHIPYESRFGHPEDFKVKYRLYTQEEGGRWQLPHQGLRSNFWYEHENHTMHGDFMIFPEFENETGDLIESGEVLSEGIARMWIFSDQLRGYHQERITVGTRGYFIEGNRTGECEVIEIVGLINNPMGT